MALRIALSTGHANQSGGSPVELAITKELTEAYFRQLTARGHDVRVVNADADRDGAPGDGMFPGALDAAAAVVVKWAQQGWMPQLYVETHTEGAGGLPGAFVIYPDATNDLDIDVRDKLGPAIARAIDAATGMGVRGTGVMSEKATSVGIQGFRLGIFRVTEPLKVSTTRCIIEHGAHDHPGNLAILQSISGRAAVVRAAVGAIEEFYGVHGLLTQVPAAVVAAASQVALGTYLYPLDLTRHYYNGRAWRYQHGVVGLRDGTTVLLDGHLLDDAQTLLGDAAKPVTA